MPTSVPGSRPTAHDPANAADRAHPAGGRLAGPAVRHEPGSAARSPLARLRESRGVGSQGFTLIELLVVLVIVAIGAALVTVALPDRTQDRLNEDAERLVALLESARAEARASGIAVRWEPAAAEATDAEQFRFIGLPSRLGLPTRWLEPGVTAEVVGARAVTLGPEPVLPAQRIVLQLADRRVVLASDGLGPFAPQAPTP